MAYRKKQTYTCPNCGTSEDVLWIIGVNLRPTAETADWTQSWDTCRSERFTVETTRRKNEWAGTVTCKTCQTVIKDVPA